MYHKIIGGKKSKGQRNIKKSIEYLLREKNPEQQNQGSYNRRRYKPY